MTGERILHIATLLALPIVVVGIMPDLFLNPHSLDPWIYFGYFHYYPEYVSQLFPNTYYGTRLAFILPGYAVHQVFPGWIAPFVLHIAVYYLGVFSLYAAAALLFTPRAGFIAALFMGGYDMFIMSAGWDYVDGMGTAYYLLTFLFVTKTALSGRRFFWGVWAGVAGAALIHTNLSAVLLLVPLPLYFLSLVPKQARGATGGPSGALVKVGLGGLCGVCAITVVLGVINRLQGGLFNFWLPSVTWALAFDFGNNPWTRPIKETFIRGWWMVIPSIALFVSIMTFASPRLPSRGNTPLPYDPSACAVALNFMFVVAVFFTLRSDLLSLCFYASYLIGPSFLVIAILFRRFESLPARSFVAAAAAAALVLILDVCFSPMLFPLEPWGKDMLPVFTERRGLQIAAAFALGLAAVFCAFRVGSRRATTWVVGLLCVMMAVLPAYSWGTRRPGLELPLQTWPLGRFGGMMGPRVPEGAMVLEAMNMVRSVAGGKKVRFWYDASERSGPEYTAVASTHLYGYSLFNTRFPEATAEYPAVTSAPPMGSVLVVLSEREHVYDEASKALEAIGVKLSFKAKGRVQRGDMVFHLTFAEVL